MFRLAAGLYIFRGIISSPPLADADKLNALRKLDQFREWRSLNDERYCLVCGKIITGRQIRVAGSAAETDHQD